MSTLVGVVYILFFLLIYGGLMVALYGYYIVAYILEGKALSAIARRRGIENPWLAWIPVGSSWMLGCISDQYRYVVHGQVRNRRKLLPWLSAALYIVAFVFGVILGLWAVRSIFAMDTSEETFLYTYFGGFIAVYLLMFVLYGVLALCSVFQHMAYYDLYRSCEPKKSLVYLLVGIFVGYPMPFFVYGCRNKDLGMPPRKDQQEAPAEQ